MNNSLVIGSSAQLAKYFPDDFDKISSRNVDFHNIICKKYKSVYLLFAECRTFMEADEAFFIKTNVDYTLKIIENIQNYVEKIVIYSTSELWNNYQGPIFLNDKFDYFYTPYIKSKEILCNTINEHRDKYFNVKIVYPFNFNSPFRKQGFLFNKIFDSLLNKNKNYVGDLDFNRDLIHPEKIVQASIKTETDVLVGLGELVNVKKFVMDLFQKTNIRYDDFLFYEQSCNLNLKRKEYYSGISYSNYEELLQLTLRDIYDHQIGKRHN